MTSVAIANAVTVRCMEPLGSANQKAVIIAEIVLRIQPEHGLRIGQQQRAPLLAGLFSSPALRSTTLLRARRLDQVDEHVAMSGRGGAGARSRHRIDVREVPVVRRV